jgi:glucosamine-6-phosphate deaminase
VTTRYGIVEASSDREHSSMKIRIAADRDQMGQWAAAEAAQVLRDTLKTRGDATILVATGASQFTVLSHLTAEPGIDWSRVTGFHLDEYLGLPITHPASFRAYLQERFVDRVPLRQFHYIDGESCPPEAECERLGRLIAESPVDVALVGIGENAHLAFNDPPADFETEQAYLIVDLDEDCRRQQWGEGWFASLEDVPRKAISMSVRQILRAHRILCSVPDERKARAVAASLEGPVSSAAPASILQTHPDVTVFLDPPAAQLLRA